MHEIAGVAVGEHRIQCGHHAVLHHRIAPFFEIEVTADVVDHDEVALQNSGEIRDGPVQAHLVEAPLLRVGQEAFHVF